MAACLGGDPPGRLGVAVSGGGDSMALLHLLAGWAPGAGVALAAVTVDHGLRDGAAAEAALAADAAARLGVAHATLHWHGWDGSGNLQDAARRARRMLIAGWAQRQGIGTVALGHTEDDQAETVLLRLARGSGVDGLSAMADRSQAAGLLWLRPLLTVPRAALRDYLRGLGVGWADDPSNDDLRFDRVKVRRALAALETAGLKRARLAETARQMARARAALETATDAAADALVQVTATGDVVINRVRFEALPAETRLRLAARSLCWIATADYRPRLAALERLLGEGGTLHGCVLQCDDLSLTFRREPAAAAGTSAAIGEIWDGRWRVTGPEGPDLRVAALGEAGLAACEGWRDTGAARASLLVAPAVWRGEELLAAPPAGRPGAWAAALIGAESALFRSGLSH